MGKDKNDNIKCEICGYQNHKEYVAYSGVCHLCGNILDPRTYFRYNMNRKLKIWRDDLPDVCGKRVNRLRDRKVEGIKTESRVGRQDEKEKKICK